MSEAAEKPTIARGTKLGQAPVVALLRCIRIRELAGLGLIGDFLAAKRSSASLTSVVAESQAQ